MLWRLKKASSLRHQAGQTIIEILIATGVVGLVMTAVAAGLTLSVKNTSQSKYRALATREAQEVAELYRRERSRLGWESFQSGVAAGDICLGADLPADTTTFLALQPGECTTGENYVLGGASYQRQAFVEVVDATQVRITVTVSWIDGTQTRSVELVVELQEWS